jgi:hypothetical protein
MLLIIRDKENAWKQDISSIFDVYMEGALTLLLRCDVQVTVKPMISAARSHYFKLHLCSDA